MQLKAGQWPTIRQLKGVSVRGLDGPVRWTEGPMIVRNPILLAPIALTVRIVEVHADSLRKANIIGLGRAYDPPPR